MHSLTRVRGVAQSHVRRAQDKQKRLHDQHAAEPSFQVGDRVFLYEPAAKSSKAHRFVRPYGGPFRIVHLYQNGFIWWISLRKQQFELHSIVFISAHQMSLAAAANQLIPWWVPSKLDGGSHVDQLPVAMPEI